MCGVFGYIGERDPLEVCLQGLEKLEYRGYDSTGIAGLHKGNLTFSKRAGKLHLLKQRLDLPTLEIAIAHTRWATHGKVSDQNAHPHFDANQTLALIHNGIIENYAELLQELKARGTALTSETDTEIVAQLIGMHYRGDPLQAFYEVLLRLKGSFSLVMIHKNHPDQILAASRDCPLSIATNDQKTESILSSDPNAFTESSLNILFLRNDEVARVKKGTVEIFGKKLKLLLKKPERLEIDFSPPSKEGFAHYMLKEIYEQPSAIQRALLGRFDQGIHFEELRLSSNFLQQIRHLWILACGTSAHAGSIAALWCEDLAHLSTSCEIASEARYRTPLLSPETLLCAISQSGETADTLAALREAAKHGCKTLGICNVKNSTLVRTVDSPLFLKAGPEISVCSTKAFTSQLTTLFLFTLYLAQLRGTLSSTQVESLFAELKKIPAQIQQILHRAPEIQQLAKKYAFYDNFFFMGRRHMFPTCLEAALKLKEISYANANGYPAGELKHGPIALLHSRFPVIAFCANEKTQEKITSNLMEVKARGAPLLAFAPTTLSHISQIADDTFWLPPTSDALAPFLSTVVGQLFAYYIAFERGCDIDQPRNLAKSVTVE